MTLKWMGDKVKGKALAAGLEGLMEGAEFILTEANKSVPHDEGQLERSGTTKLDKSSKQSAVGYDTPYAVKLHEHPEYNFQGKGEGKWLEKAIKDGSNKKAAMDHIAGKLKKALKG